MTLAEQWVAFYTIVRKEIRRFLRIWMQTLLPPAITMSLYFVIFGALIGSRIGQMGGFSYMEFVVPGLIMMSVITNAYSNVVSSFFGAKFQRFVEEILVSPMSNNTVLWGFVSGGVARGLLVGFINAVFANNFDDVSIVPVFVLTPLTYLGGVFYSIDLLPDFWAAVSRLNPMLYIVNAFRYGVLGVSDVNVTTAFLMVGGFTLAAYAYCMYLLSSGTRLRQ